MTQWIQGAVKHPGSLRRYAKEHRLMTSKDTIDLDRTKAYVQRNEKGETKSHRLRQVNFAKNVKRLKA